MYQYFLGLDFETANAGRASACAVGLHLVDKRGNVLLSEDLLINPEDDFDAFNIAIHGIREKDVQNSPHFPAIHRQLADLLKNYPNTLVVCHNAAFDMSVLRTACERYRLPYLCFDYVCTYRIARSCFPDFYSFTLDSLSRKFLLPKFKHHNALADATQALHLLGAMQRKMSACSLLELMDMANLDFGVMLERDYKACRVKKKSKK